MTQKQKAKELVDRFEKVIPFKGFIFPNEISKYKKQCALICVDEILTLCDRFKTKPLNKECFNEYWQEVKQELLKK